MTDVSAPLTTKSAELRPGRARDGDDRPSTKRRRHESQDRQRREIGLMRQSDGTNAPSFVGSSSGIHFVRSVYQALTKSQPRVHILPQTPDQNIVPGEEDQLDEAIPYSSKNLWSPNEVAAADGEDLGFDFETLQTWSESYFENWHTAYPFIHAPSILEYLEQEVRPNNLENLHGHQSPRFTIIRSIMSISLADRRQSGHRSTQPIPASLVFKSFKEAMESVQDMLFLPTSIEALQAVVSVQLFLVSMLRLNGASRLGGMIVRMTFQMGLHRCPTRYAGFDTEQAELRRRLFWTIYCIDRHLCQSLGLPLTIRDDDVDVCYFDDEKHSAENRHRTIMDDRLRVLNFLTRHASIKGQIMELRNKSVHQRTANRDQATLISARIDKWANDLQYTLETSEHGETGDVNKLHQAILLVLQHESAISLNRPLLALERHTSEYMAALQTCIRASRSTITILHGYLKNTTMQDISSSTPAPLLWPSLTWCVWMSAFIVLHAAIEGEMPKPVARRLADQSVEVLRQLALRGSVWPNVCAVAIDDLFLRLLLDSAVTTPQSPSIPQSESTQALDHSHPAITLPRNATRYQNFSQQPNFFPQPGRNGQNSLQSHAANVMGPSPSSFDQHVTIPWMSGPDAAAATSNNIFEQFDIPFWMGDDQYSSLLDFEI
ncbi:hypothetical protein D6D21_03657 [Aureobasidium pullulans]|uniref:Xylanolytic transcriptional activator regulatory domain-containing protein n=1 Tax=Aureobasidium pullulans TaxID=5580 RepID=A0AB74J299_AURPU|nr:hypothetical protein D6D21_03657 [Aureobasidium pullulans]